MNNVLEERINELLIRNKRNTKSRFNKFRAELFILEHIYDENPEQLTTDEKRRLVKLEKRLAYLRGGASIITLAYLSIIPGILTYKRLLETQNPIDAVATGSIILLGSFASVGMAYLGTIPYGKSRRIRI